MVNMNNITLDQFFHAVIAFGILLILAAVLMGFLKTRSHR